MNARLIVILIAIALFACKEEIIVPEKKIPQYKIDYNSDRQGDTLILSISPQNPSPIKCWVWIHDEMILETTISANESLDTSIVVDSLKWTLDDVDFSSRFGGMQKIDSVTMFLPWPKGIRYKVIQAYNGGFSHQSEFSRYALDFDLSVGDTVTAAQDGVVVGVVEGYTEGGNDSRLRDYANFITLYHPEFGVYSQYVHIKHNGALVSIGDEVKVNQPIALSGKVGFTSIPHLHFNVLGQKGNGDLKSIPVYFAPAISGHKMRRGSSWKRSKEE